MKSPLDTPAGAGILSAIEAAQKYMAAQSGRHLRSVVLLVLHDDGMAADETIACAIARHGDGNRNDVEAAIMTLAASFGAKAEIENGQGTLDFEADALDAAGLVH